MGPNIFKKIAKMSLELLGLLLELLLELLLLLLYAFYHVLILGRRAAPVILPNIPSRGPAALGGAVAFSAPTCALFALGLACSGSPVALAEKKSV